MYLLSKQISSLSLLISPLGVAQSMISKLSLWEFWLGPSLTENPEVMSRERYTFI